jgi:hypothetical protein
VYGTLALVIATPAAGISENKLVQQIKDLLAQYTVRYDIVIQ